MPTGGVSKARFVLFNTGESGEVASVGGYRFLSCNVSKEVSCLCTCFCSSFHLGCRQLYESIWFGVTEMSMVLAIN